MSDFTVLKDVEATLKQVLDEHLDPLVKPGNIVFKSPKEIQDDPPTPTLSIFLFKVDENSYLKNQEMQNLNHKKIKYPPISLDLFYLIIPFAKERNQEHLILGRVIQIFHDHSVLKGRILRDGLEGSSEELHVTLYPTPFEELFQLWQGFTEKSFKVSVCYRVTPIKIDSTYEMDAKRVVEKRDEYYQKGGGAPGPNR